MEKKTKIISTNSVLTVSVTGSFCELSCKHCNKKYLKSMVDIDDKLLLEKINNNRINHILISGGTLKTGSVPFYKKINRINEIKDSSKKINVHTGIIPEDYFLNTLIFDTISIDVIGSEKILNEVYNLNLKLDLFYNNILKYKEFLDNIDPKKPEIVPHITIGIYYGLNSFEEMAIDFLTQINPKKLVLNVLIPTKGTPFEKIKEISVDRIMEIFKYAKIKLPKSLIYLGCMRPFGESRDKIDFKFLDSGIDAIVNPSRNFLRRVEDSKQIIKVEGCCSLI